MNSSNTMLQSGPNTRSSARNRKHKAQKSKKRKCKAANTLLNENKKHINKSPNVEVSVKQSEDDDVPFRFKHSSRTLLSKEKVKDISDWIANHAMNAVCPDEDDFLKEHDDLHSIYYNETTKPVVGGVKVEDVNKPQMIVKCKSRPQRHRPPLSLEGWRVIMDQEENIKLQGYLIVRGDMTTGQLITTSPVEKWRHGRIIETVDHKTYQLVGEMLDPSGDIPMFVNQILNRKNFTNWRWLRGYLPRSRIAKTPKRAKEEVDRLNVSCCAENSDSTSFNLLPKVPLSNVNLKKRTHELEEEGDCRNNIMSVPAKRLRYQKVPHAKEGQLKSSSEAVKSNQRPRVNGDVYLENLYLSPLSQVLKKKKQCPVDKDKVLIESTPVRRSDRSLKRASCLCCSPNVFSTCPDSTPKKTKDFKSACNKKVVDGSRCRRSLVMKSPVSKYLRTPGRPLTRSLTTRSMRSLAKSPCSTCFTSPKRPPPWLWKPITSITPKKSPKVMLKRVFVEANYTPKSLYRSLKGSAKKGKEASQKQLKKIEPASKKTKPKVSAKINAVTRGDTVPKKRAKKQAERVSRVLSPSLQVSRKPPLRPQTKAKKKVNLEGKVQAKQNAKPKEKKEKQKGKKQEKLHVKISLKTAKSPVTTPHKAKRTLAKTPNPLQKTVISPGKIVKSRRKLVKTPRKAVKKTAKASRETCKTAIDTPTPPPIKMKTPIKNQAKMEAKKHMKTDTKSQEIKQKGKSNNKMKGPKATDCSSKKSTEDPEALPPIDCHFSLPQPDDTISMASNASDSSCGPSASVVYALNRMKDIAEMKAPRTLRERQIQDEKLEQLQNEVVKDEDDPLASLGLLYTGITNEICDYNQLLTKRRHSKSDSCCTPPTRYIIDEQGSNEDAVSSVATPSLLSYEPQRKAIQSYVQRQRAWNCRTNRPTNTDEDTNTPKRPSEMVPSMDYSVFREEDSDSGPESLVFEQIESEVYR